MYAELWAMYWAVLSPILGHAASLMDLSSLLTASHSVVAMTMKKDDALISSFSNSWVPLLVALTAEYAQQVN